MKSAKQLRKYAFYGLPGAGKSTSVKMLTDQAQQHNYWVENIRFAAPLYEAQAVIYRLAGKPLEEKSQQDGRLLNFLGGHFRKINENSLIEFFSTAENASINHFLSQPTLQGLLLNDDMRHSEALFLKSRKYQLVQIVAPMEICIKRRELRNDLTLGNANDITESGIEKIIPDKVITNNGTLSDLASKIASFIANI